MSEVSVWHSLCCLKSTYSEATLELGITVLGSGMALYDKLDEIKDAKNLSKYISEKG